MRYFIIVLSLVWSTNVLAEEPDLLVNHLFERLRIVISTKVACDNDAVGKRASAQRLDGLYIPGCWIEEPDHPELVRINWHKR